jgi:hypothetical protein
MTKQTEQITDSAKHIEVIPQRHREIFCNKQSNSQRYTTDWIFGWPTNVARNDKGQPLIFMHTQADREQLKRMR